MHYNRTFGLCGVAASIAFTLTVWGQDAQQSQPNRSEEIAQNIANKERVIAQFRADHPGGDFLEIGNRIQRVYGDAFGSGASPHEAADQFRRSYSGMFGVQADDLLPQASYEGGVHLQPMMMEDGRYKFTLVNYTQTRDGIKVYRSSLGVLVRNDPNYPVVLAAANLRDIENFTVDQAMLDGVNAAAAVANARKSMPRNSVFSQAQPVIFAGVDEHPHPATLAVTFTGEGGNYFAGDFSRREFVADAATGAILYSESLIYDIDVTGTVQGLVTDGYVAGVCANENSQPLPYLRVDVVGGSSAFANANGQFTIPNAGSTDVTVNSPLIGQFFTVNNTQAATSVVSQAATPGVPASILHNSANAGGNEQTLAEVNAYRHANITRDMVVSFNPSFPTVSTQSGFPVNVNSTAGTCNAFYSASTINFYLLGGGCNNSAFGTVVHHEYGHNVVAKGGSGQGGYGEGMGDVMGVLITDAPITGIGFQACNSGIRTANNACQYSAASCSTGTGCGSEVHACGNLISGCVWSLRNNLAATNPGTYRQILGNLAVNSILLHTGLSTIAPQITIDYLTLDDNDANQSNGTPHRTEIANAFGAHNMPAPALPALLISFPNGRPTSVSPVGGTLIRALVSPGAETPAPGATLFANVGAGYVNIPMSLVAANTYEAAIPASTCGTTVRYYVSAVSTVATGVVSPTGAPTAFYDAISAVSLDSMFADNFQTNLGWSVVTTATDGPWDRGVPVSGCNRGAPTTDADGSGSCYLTDNSAASACNSDVDGGATTLTSPNMDASTGTCLLSYWRWYDNLDPSNTSQDDPFLVQISFNGGTNWQALETVGPTGAEANGGWVFKSFTVNSLAGFTPTAQLRIRFTAQDNTPASVVEAAVDGVKLQRLVCATAVPGDVNGDGSVNVADLLAVITAWGACPAAPATCPADVSPTGGDGQVNVADLLFVITNWG